ncbi:MAG: AraC family transcriptional regulator [Mobilitalea sp.]
MEWLDRLNASIHYIEENLTGEIDYNQAAKLACCSTFHFQRMFSYMASIPLSEYIRRRRMTLAALELQKSDIKIIDLTLKYGYESPTSFNRVFQSVHGMTPTAAREEGIMLKAYPRIVFLISIKGDVEMNYMIKKKDSFRIVGVKEHMELDVEKNMSRVPKLWAETFQNGMFAKICSIANQEPKGVLGVSTCMNGQELDYYIACASNMPAQETMVEYNVPATTWAIFECIGPMPTAIQDLQKRIITEWLPTSGYEYADAPDIEVYPEGDTSSLNYQCEVWLPVVKKD